MDDRELSENVGGAIMKRDARRSVEERERGRAGATMDDPRVRRMHNFLNAHGFNIHPHYVAQALAAADRVSEDRAAKLEAVVREMIEAMLLTRDYVGQELLPAKHGWSWFDAIENARAALAGLPGPQGEK